MLAGILEAQVRRFNSGTRSLDVLALRVAENQRLHARASHRGLAGGEAVRVADIGTDLKVGDVGVLCLGEGGLRFFNIGFSESNSSGIALSQVDNSGQRNLRPERDRADRAEGREKSEARQPPGSARIGDRFRGHMHGQRFACCDSGFGVRRRSASWSLKSCAGR